MVKEATLYETLGGEAAITAAVDEFYARVLADESLAHFFVDTSLAQLKEHQRAFFTQALGGPAAYTGLSMTEAHAGRGIGSADFDRVAQHLAATLVALDVGQAGINQVIDAIASLKPDIVGSPTPATF